MDQDKQQPTASTDPVKDKARDTLRAEKSTSKEPVASKAGLETEVKNKEKMTRTGKGKSNNKSEKAPKKSSGLLTGLFFLLLVAGLGGTGYMVYEQNKAIGILFDQMNEFSQEKRTLADTVSLLGEEVLALQESLSQADSLIAEQNDRLTELNSEIINTRLRINDNGAIASDAWKLAEAQSLLRLAQQRLVTSRDVTTAIALLIEADAVLRTINDQAIFSIREVIAVDLASLRAVEIVDIQGVYSQLGALAGQIDQLQVETGNDRGSLLGSVKDQEQEAEIVDEAGEIDGLESAGWLDRVRNSLKEYIVVRRRDEPLQPLLTPEQEYTVRENIKLQLQQARIAVLKGEQAVYEQSLGEAAENIERFLVGEPALKESILSSVRTLAAQKTLTRVPDITNSISAISQILPADLQQPGGNQ